MDSISDNTIFFTLAVILVILFGMNYDKNKDIKVTFDSYLPITDDDNTDNINTTDSNYIGNLDKLLLISAARSGSRDRKTELAPRVSLPNIGCDQPLPTPTWDMVNAASVSDDKYSSMSTSQYAKCAYKC